MAGNHNSGDPNAKPPVAIASRFKPGQSGNPGGVSRELAELRQSFIRRLREDFAKRGDQAIADVREQDPASYLRVIASLMPKEIEVREVTDVRELSTAELIAIAASGSAGTAGTPAGADEPRAVH